MNAKAALPPATSSAGWFSYDPSDGFETHNTESEAKARAEKALEWYRDEAQSDGWSEDVNFVTWGRISENIVERREGDGFEYELRPNPKLSHPAPQTSATAENGGQP